ncbi:MAG TPA: HD domain-containing phosphohydrolase [Bacilli bacterium]|nr:HD domain-containing phosphohydrolase [Bacilli bacterium]
MLNFLINDLMHISLNITIDAFVIISITSFYLFIRRKFMHNKLLNSLIAGISFAIAIFLIMANPTSDFVLEVSDGHAPLLAIVAAFYGPIPAGITLVVGLLVRIFLIETATPQLIAAILTMVASTLIGLVWCFYINKKFKKMPAFARYLILGYIVQFVNIGFIVIFSESLGKSFLIHLVPLLVFYPFVTAIVGLITKEYFNYVDFADNYEELDLQRKAAINATNTMELYALDHELKYIFFNDFHGQQIKRFYKAKPEEGEEILPLIKNDVIRERLSETFNETLAGREQIKTIEVEDKPGKFLREHYTPIKDRAGNIIGITVFSEEISELKKHEANITFLSYHDMLTKLKNRRYFYERVEVIRKLDQSVGVVYFDINSLKIMNDAFGHDTGDELLKIVARVLKKHFEKHGDVCRVGGDEIIALLDCPSCQDEKHVHELIKNFNDELQNIKIKSVYLSVSAGYAFAKTGREIHRAILIAEDNMYHQKLRDSIQHRSDILYSIYEQVIEHNIDYIKNYELVNQYAQKLGTKLGLSDYELKMLDHIAKFRDVGKISIPASILNKPNKLTEREYLIVKKHPEVGYRMLSGTKNYSEIAYDVLTHHEYYDGTGYPRGLKGEEIPLRARITLIAVAYVSMTSDRPYRAKRSHAEAIAELKRCRGTMFDPAILDVFLTLF